MAKRTTSPPRKRRAAPSMTLWVMGCFILAAAIGVLGWYWQATLPLKDISVSGTQHAAIEDVIAAARVDSSELLFSIDPALIAERVKRHPWVGDAKVRRIPTGTLSIHVTEREPVVLVLTTRGRPSHYLDRQGFHMPIVEPGGYDVPLLRGTSEFNPQKPEEGDSLLELLASIASLDDEVVGLISDITMGRDGAAVHTVPIDTRGSISVRMGRSGYAEKFERLNAFWKQAVLTKEDTRFTMVDLRFDNQIVTREERIQR